MCAIQKVKIILPYILEGEEREKWGGLWHYLSVCP